MPNDTTVPPPALADPELLQELEEYYGTSVFPYDEAREAEAFVQRVGRLLRENPGFSAQYPELAAGYAALLVKCQFYALPWLSEGEIVELFRRHFSVAFRRASQLDLWRKLKVVLVTDYLIDQRDEVKAKLRQALEQNTEVVTSQRLTTGGQALEPTVGNWLRDYTSAVGTGPAESIRQAEYLTASPNVKAASDVERGRLAWLFELYEHLKRSSLTPEGLEEPIGTNVDGREVTLTGGQVEELPAEMQRLLEKFRKAGLLPGTPPTSPPSPAPAGPPSIASPVVHPPAPPKQTSVAADDVPTAPSLLNSPAVQQQLAAWRQPGVTSERLRDALFSAFREQRRDATLAALAALAERGDLAALLRQDSRFYYLLADAYRRRQRSEELKAFHLSSADPRHLRALVRLALEGQLKLSEDDAAHVGVDLTNLARQRLGSAPHWAYYDAAAARYRWLP